MTRCGGPTLSSQACAGGELRLQRQVDEIAGYRDVVGPLRLHVGDQRVQHLAAVIFVAVAGPVEIAERTLAREIAQPRRGQRRQMRIGQMRQREMPSSVIPRSAAFPVDIEPSHDHVGDAFPRIKRDSCPSEVCVTALQHLRKRLEPLAAAGLPSLLADGPRHDARGPRRRARWRRQRCSWSGTAMSPAGTCRAAGSRSARRFLEAPAARAGGGGADRT